MQQERFFLKKVNDVEQIEIEFEDFLPPKLFKLDDVIFEVGEIKHHVIGSEVDAKSIGLPYKFEAREDATTVFWAIKKSVPYRGKVYLGCRVASCHVSAFEDNEGKCPAHLTLTYHEGVLVSAVGMLQHRDNCETMSMETNRPLHDKLVTVNNHHTYPNECF